MKEIIKIFYIVALIPARSDSKGIKYKKIQGQAINFSLNSAWSGVKTH